MASGFKGCYQLSKSYRVLLYYFHDIVPGRVPYSETLEGVTNPKRIGVGSGQGGGQWIISTGSGTFGISPSNGWMLLILADQCRTSQLTPSAEASKEVTGKVTATTVAEVIACRGGMSTVSTQSLLGAIHSPQGWPVLASFHVARTHPLDRSLLANDYNPRQYNLKQLPQTCLS